MNRVHLQTFLKTTFCKNIEKHVDTPPIEAHPQKNAIAGLYSVRAILVAKEINFLWNSHGRSIQLYLLRHVLKVTPGLGRNSPRTRVLMVPTSSRAKLNNSLERNKLNSDFRKSYAGRHGEQSKFQRWKNS